MHGPGGIGVGRGFEENLISGGDRGIQLVAVPGVMVGRVVHLRPADQKAHTRPCPVLTFQTLMYCPGGLLEVPAFPVDAIQVEQRGREQLSDFGPHPCGPGRGQRCAVGGPQAEHAVVEVLSTMMSEVQRSAGAGEHMVRLCRLGTVLRVDGEQAPQNSCRLLVVAGQKQRGAEILGGHEPLGVVRTEGASPR